MSSSARKKSSRRVPNHGRRQSTNPQKTEILINVYDLLPPGRLSSVLWAFGTSLLHSGVVIKGREYAYGGHEHQGMSGVYWTRPRSEPPGGTFRCEILHGFTMNNDEEIAEMIKEISDEFLGPSYNLLNKNCNHFTNALCQKMTSRSAPSWLNRAAGIGVALPCVVPREWIEPPDHDTAEGELLDEDRYDERSTMLRRASFERHHHGDVEAAVGGSAAAPSEEVDAGGADDGGEAISRDTSGRVMPASERAPPLHHL